MGLGTRDVFGPSEHSSQSQLSETFNVKLHTGWRNARETTKETSAGEKCEINIDLLTKSSSTFYFLNHMNLFQVLSPYFFIFLFVLSFNLTLVLPVRSLLQVSTLKPFPMDVNVSVTLTHQTKD